MYYTTSGIFWISGNAMEAYLIPYLILYMIVINIAGCSLMYIDKRRARKHQWRIPEKMLFLFALLGGSLGSIVGMYTFRHKTRHWYFVVGMPVILIAQILLLVGMIYYSHQLLML